MPKNNDSARVCYTTSTLVEETRILTNFLVNYIQLGRTVGRGSQVFLRHTLEEMAQELAFKLIGLVDQEPQRMFLHPRTRLVHQNRNISISFFW